MLKKNVLLVLSLLLFGLVVASAQDTTRIQQISREMEQVQADFIAGKITPQQLQQRLSELSQQMEAARSSFNSQGASFSQAQLQRIETLLDQDKSLEAQFNNGHISEASYTQQANTLRTELNQIVEPFKGSPSASIQYTEVEEKIKKLWPGSIMGWPPNEGAFPRDERDRSYLEVGDLNRPLRQAPNTRASYSPTTRIGGAFGFIGGYRIFQTGANQAALEDLRRQIETATGKTMGRNQRGDGYFLEFIDNRSNNRDDNRRYWSTHSITLKNDGTLEYQVRDTSFDYGTDAPKNEEE